MNILSLNIYVACSVTCSSDNAVVVFDKDDIKKAVESALMNDSRLPVDYLRINKLKTIVIGDVIEDVETNNK